MNEADYLKSCKLRNQLRLMQYDVNLSQKQRKLANEFFKEIGEHPQYPFVHPDVIRKMISKIEGVCV